MIVCVNCRREMRCDKNEVAADFGHGHTYPGDRFKCPVCGFMILACNRAPSYNPEYRGGEFLKMDTGEMESRLTPPAPRLSPEAFILAQYALERFRQEERERVIVGGHDPFRPERARDAEKMAIALERVLGESRAPSR